MVNDQFIIIHHKNNCHERKHLKNKSFDFAVIIVKFYQYFSQEHNEFILSWQIVRSGTVIGALIREAEHDESMKDFIHKFSIKLKEANEWEY